MKTFTQKVLEIVSRIPRGKVLTYGQVATQAGSPNAARAVGSIMANNTDLSIPCHRVVRSDGNLGPYNGLRGKDKATLLREEGYITT